MNPSPIVYIEIPAPDIEKSGSFYSAVFHWKIEPSHLSDQPYWMFNTGQNELMGALDSSKPVSDSGIIFYIKVDDIEKCLDEIKKLNGSVVREKFEIGGGYGFSAVFKDPNGNCLGLWAKT